MVRDPNCVGVGARSAGSIPVGIVSTSCAEAGSMTATVFGSASSGSPPPLARIAAMAAASSRPPPNAMARAPRRRCAGPRSSRVRGGALISGSWLRMARSSRCSSGPGSIRARVPALGARRGRPREPRPGGRTCRARASAVRAIARVSDGPRPTAPTRRSARRGG